MPNSNHPVLEGRMNKYFEEKLLVNGNKVYYDNVTTTF